MSLLILAALGLVSIVSLVVVLILVKSNRTSSEAIADLNENLNKAKESVKLFNRFLDRKNSFVFDELQLFSAFNMQILAMRNAIETIDYARIVEESNKVLRNHSMVFNDLQSQRLYNDFLNTLEEIVNL